MSRRAVGRWRWVDDEEGSVLPLALGYAVLTIALIFACVCATSLFLAQKRLDALADATALAAADGFALALEDGEPVASLDDARVADAASTFLRDVGATERLVSATTPDGLSVRATIAGEWHPPIVSVFVPDGVALEAAATARTALQ